MRFDRTWISAVSLALGVSFAPQLMAQDASSEAAPVEAAPADAGKTAMPAATNAVDESLPSSTRAREGKMVGVGLHYGLIVGVISGYGLDVHYQLFRDLHVGLGYYSGSIDLKSLVDDTSSTKVEKFDLSSSLLLLQGRYFVGNSFNLGFGLGQRRVKAEYSIRAVGVDAGIDGDIEATTTVGNLTLGNLWTWESGVSFGVDWVGYNAAFGAKSKAHTKQTGTAAPDAGLKDVNDDAKDTGKKIGKLGSPMLLVMNLGYSF